MSFTEYNVDYSAEVLRAAKPSEARKCEKAGRYPKTIDV